MPSGYYKRKIIELDCVDCGCKLRRKKIKRKEDKAVCVKCQRKRFIKRHPEYIKQKKEYEREWYFKNKDLVLQRTNDWAKNNKDKTNVYKKNWIERNREKRNKYLREYSKKKRASNIKIRINRSISASILSALKKKKDGRRWEELVGYTIKDLINHLEKQFELWMNWDNYGKYDKNKKTWHIDHIKPISSFNFNSYNDSDFKECWTLENLQPLEASKNMIKSNKLYE